MTRDPAGECLQLRNEGKASPYLGEERLSEETSKKVGRSGQGRDTGLQSQAKLRGSGERKNISRWYDK